MHLVDDARAKGARIVALGPADAATRLFGPVLAIGVTSDMAIMREEIFGPLLPVETYDDARRRDRDDQCTAASARLVFFGDDAARRDRVLRETLARRRDGRTIRYGISCTRACRSAASARRAAARITASGALSHLVTRNRSSCNRARRGQAAVPAVWQDVRADARVAFAVAPIAAGTRR